MDADFQSYEIYEHYCLDMDSDEKVLTAIVCDFDDMLFKVNRTQALLFACCMLISVPFLIITAVLYLLIPELNDLHGKSLAAHSICLASGFFLLAFTQFRDMYSIEGTFLMQNLNVIFLIKHMLSFVSDASRPLQFSVAASLKAENRFPLFSTML